MLRQRQGRYLDSGISARLGLARSGVTGSITNLTNLTNERGNRFALGTPFQHHSRRRAIACRPR